MNIRQFEEFQQFICIIKNHALIFAASFIEMIRLSRKVEGSGPMTPWQPSVTGNGANSCPKGTDETKRQWTSK
jgi:hypothetical protein